ncbi:hypothetical protein HELRODRAFT_160848 [Helobdella robusta]|uniref:Laminin G domain-containing protein n=1 Tax=Helobdella robusta TaxID=6412 RepID=T1EQT6_HELRO|nr:hypothetical protein HELRODRAFT_160848 [Helobdella robusta]ESO06658.1 hypothetical protein HELRODRAFT_160848 [Helobdella robusta]
MESKRRRKKLESEKRGSEKNKNQQAVLHQNKAENAKIDKRPTEMKTDSRYVNNRPKRNTITTDTQLIPTNTNTHGIPTSGYTPGKDANKDNRYNEGGTKNVPGDNHGVKFLKSFVVNNAVTIKSCKYMLAVKQKIYGVFHVALKFRTTFPSVVLMTSVGGPLNRDFLHLELLNGHVRYSYDVGSGPRVRVFRRNLTTHWLIVDDVIRLHDNLPAIKSVYYDLANDWLFFGGAPNSGPIRNGDGLKYQNNFYSSGKNYKYANYYNEGAGCGGRGFLGCLGDISVNGASMRKVQKEKKIVFATKKKMIRMIENDDDDDDGVKDDDDDGGDGGKGISDYDGNDDEDDDEDNVEDEEEDDDEEEEEIAEGCQETSELRLLDFKEMKLN